MAATRTRLFLHSFSSSPAAPSFGPLSRLFSSSAGESGSSSKVVIEPAKSSATASIHSKVEDKKLTEFSVHESFWYGPRWRMPFEFAKARKKYPKIPAEKVDSSVFWGKGREPPKFLGVLNFPVYSVMVKAHYKDRKVIGRTMQVIGRDVQELEAAAERLKSSE